MLFLSDESLEVLYGGAARGGKTIAQLAGALQYATVPGYHALLLRRTYADLNLPEALIPLSHQWLQGKASWNGKLSEWTFDSGATLTFGYLESEIDKYRYQGTAFQYIGPDELTQFTLSQYTYMFSRLCPLPGVDVPLRMRTTSNPGGVGHDWVKKRFLVERESGRRFIGARLEDNPHIDAVQYELSLKQLDPITRRQLRFGDWDISTDGVFKRGWFGYWKREGEFYRLQGRGPDRLVRISDCWRFAVVDCAGVEKRKPSHDPDFSVDQTYDITPTGDMLLIGQWRKQAATTETEDAIVRETGKYDTPYDLVEYAHVGIGIIQHLRRRGIAVRSIPAHKSKLVRSQTAQIRAEAGTVFLPAGERWVVDELEPELYSFTGTDLDAHDDQVDCLSHAAKWVQKMAGAVTSELDETRNARHAELESKQETAAEQSDDERRDMALARAHEARSGEMWAGFDGDDDD